MYRKKGIIQSIHSRLGANMEGDEGGIVCFPKMPLLFSDEIVLVYVTEKNPIAPYSYVLYLMAIQSLKGI